MSAPRTRSRSPAGAEQPSAVGNSRVALRTLRPLAGHLRAVGVDPTAFFGELGIDLAGLLAPGASIPMPQHLEIWRRAEERLQDPSLGLHVLERLELRLLERVQHETEWVVLQMFVLSSTLEKGLARFARYFPATFYGSEITLTRASQVVEIRHRVLGGPQLPRSFAEFILGLLARLIHEVAAVPVRPRRIAFAHAAPSSLDSAHRILPVRPDYAAEGSLIALDARDLAAPIRAPNPVLLAGLERQGEQLLARLPPLGSLVDQVRALITAELGGGNPSAEAIAEALQISVRTLSRRLQELGTSHRALCDEIRGALARRALEEGRAVHVVARELGFSEVSAFHRAFRRWFGCSPSAFVRAQRA
ncbi:MAG: AraC family transcriptional regulator ligand-binding domain-containing protein [Nannocystis sp.]|nr:AraC family transcriptional regulator ligand-binding domain-containing protein [Nannocystis sp.]